MIVTFVDPTGEYEKTKEFPEDCTFYIDPDANLIIKDKNSKPIAVYARFVWRHIA